MNAKRPSRSSKRAFHGSALYWRRTCCADMEPVNEKRRSAALAGHNFLWQRRSGKYEQNKASPIERKKPTRQPRGRACVSIGEEVASHQETVTLQDPETLPGRPAHGHTGRGTPLRSQAPRRSQENYLFSHCFPQFPSNTAPSVGRLIRLNPTNSCSSHDNRQLSKTVR